MPKLFAISTFRSIFFLSLYQALYFFYDIIFHSRLISPVWDPNYNWYVYAEKLLVMSLAISIIIVFMKQFNNYKVPMLKIANGINASKNTVKDSLVVKTPFTVADNFAKN